MYFNRRKFCKRNFLEVKNSQNFLDKLSWIVKAVKFSGKSTNKRIILNNRTVFRNKTNFLFEKSIKWSLSILHEKNEWIYIFRGIHFREKMSKVSPIKVSETNVCTKLKQTSLIWYYLQTSRDEEISMLKRKLKDAHSKELERDEIISALRSKNENLLLGYNVSQINWYRRMKMNKNT